MLLSLVLSNDRLPRAAELAAEVPILRGSSIAERRKSYDEPLRGRLSKQQGRSQVVFFDGEVLSELHEA